ncbi:RadC family protein [Ornithobacterium rhinotracheale]
MKEEKRERLFETKPLNEWAEDDRPREKLMLKGKDALSDAELLAIIMGSGNREETAVDLAKRILQDHHHNWNELAKRSVSELKKYKGVGEVKAIGIVSALEIGRRRAKQTPVRRPQIKSSQSAYEYLRHELEDLHVEEFWVLFLNQSNRVIAAQKISEGGIVGALVDVRVLFKKAIEMYATAVIVAHNHPSGALHPSTEDLQITAKIKEAGNVLNIPMLDHLIIAQSGYYSFADDGQV